MKQFASAIALWMVFAQACAETQPGPRAQGGTRAAPAKCSACHLAPKEHSLAADRWDNYLKNHKRRLRLTEEDKAFLHDFLVGGPPPAGAQP
jgi:hypothetical protein